MTPLVRYSRSLLFLLGVLFPLLQYHSCKDVGVIPPEDNSPDTTSHNFTWTIDTLGDGNSSVLNDVAIINDTLAYAVGEIYLKDSTSQFDPAAYNLAKWNGQRWQLVRVPTEAFGGSIGNYPIRTVFAFGSNDVWTFSIAGSYSHWNGQSWTTAYVAERSGGAEKLWGTSASNLYLVGTNGSISLYNGNVWQKLTSGTTLDVQDIWGSTANGQTEILAVASNRQFNEGKMVLKISSTTVIPLSVGGLPWSLRGIWFDPGKQYYVVGDGIYFTDRTDSLSSWKGGANIITTFYSYAIRGNRANDLFIAGAFGDLLHYNGSWYQYSQLRLDQGSWYRVEIKGNVVVAVGFTGSKAIVARGVRN
ncbi:MAG: glucosyl transferase [Ignavibacteriales bacterium]|nr:glucosyl transferase [Ignavibacteriales bacterium]